MGSSFWRIVAGSFIGKLLATIFIAACTVFGFGPETWVEFMIAGLPEWITPSVARVVFLGFGLLTVVALFVFGRRNIGAEYSLASTTTPPSDRRARLKIIGFGLHFSPKPTLSYGVENYGECAATGAVHQVWAEWHDRIRPDPPIPGEAGTREIIPANSTIAVERPLTDYYRHRLFASTYDPPVVSPDEWARLDSTTDYVIGIRIVYWDGTGVRRTTQSHHRFNPDNGAIGQDFYEET
jgi:hypothetical protein